MKENWLVGSRFVDTEMVQLHFLVLNLFSILCLLLRDVTQDPYILCYYTSRISVSLLV